MSVGGGDPSSAAVVGDEPFGECPGMTIPAALLALRPRFTARAARWRIGFIALSTDHTSERDFALMRPSPEVVVYVNRIAFENPMTRESLLAMRPFLTDAASLILPGESLDALVFGCTSASALIGDAAVCDALQAAKPGVAVVTPASAALAAFASLGSRRVSLLAPYSARVTEGIAAYFEMSGLTVLNAACLGIMDDRDVARLEADTIIEAALAACHPEAEALFISCTALPAVTTLQVIEDRLGLPVVSSNQATFWRALRLAGCGDRIQGFGRLFSEPGSARQGLDPAVLA